MATIRVQKDKQNPYVLLNKTALFDDKLSFKAKGIFAYLMSKPDNWKCKIEDLKNNAKDGTDSIKAGLRELRENGYMIKRPIKNSKNVIVEWEEILYEIPQDVAKEIFKEQEIKRKASLEKRRLKSTSGKSISGFSTNGKPNYIINNDILNNDILNNDTSSSSEYIKELIIFFEENICKLRKTTLPKFLELIKHKQYTNEFILAVIEECTLTNVNSYKGFETAVNNYKNANCKTGEDVHKYAIEFTKKKKQKNNSYIKKSNKENIFNSYEGQRKYTKEDEKFLDVFASARDISEIDRNSLSDDFKLRYDDYINSNINDNEDDKDKYNDLFRQLIGQGY